jgi:hypothetical protein
VPENCAGGLVAGFGAEVVHTGLDGNNHGPNGRDQRGTVVNKNLSRGRLELDWSMPVNLAQRLRGDGRNTGVLRVFRMTGPALDLRSQDTCLLRGPGHKCEPERKHERKGRD